MTARFWFRIVTASGARSTVWTVTERGARAALAQFKQAGVRVVARGERKPDKHMHRVD